MRSDPTNFREFVNLLKVHSTISDEEIEAALESLGGVTGVIESNLPISGYEAIGCLAGESLDTPGLVSLLEAMGEELTRFPGERYYFAEGLVVMAADRLNDRELSGIVESAPSEFQNFLKRHIQHRK